MEVAARPVPLESGMGVVSLKVAAGPVPLELGMRVVSLKVAARPVPLELEMGVRPTAVRQAWLRPGEEVRPSAVVKRRLPEPGMGVEDG